MTDAFAKVSALLTQIIHHVINAGTKFEFDYCFCVSTVQLGNVRLMNGLSQLQGGKRGEGEYGMGWGFSHYSFWNLGI